MGKMHLVVQFVYVSPSRSISDFRLCELETDGFSKAFGTPYAAALESQKEAELFDLTKIAPVHPWSSPQLISHENLSKRCALVIAIVWKIGENFKLSPHSQITIPDDVEQPKRRFWVVDIGNNAVLARCGDVDQARAEFASFVKSFGGQI